ncbi:MAG: DNA/RNA non-specific endonuclease [Verrucomicrobia bacterium]|nr:DNA/RNA non-specific endonuclease [Verrucomicrobiota bacterium]
MPMGNPDEATTSSTARTKYLIQKRQYALSYNDDTHQANWVSWSYTSDDTGSQARTDAWAVEELLPSGFLRIGTSTFGTPWDRGHMCPSADRTTNFEDNKQTFRMSNIIPHHANNNQGLWATFETYTRSLAAGGNEVLIITGPSEFNGNTIGNGMQIPGSVWKIAVIAPNASSSVPANQRLTSSSRVIAILTPNIGTAEGLVNNWKSYRTSVEQIEQLTGFTFFTEVDPSVATYLKNVVDTGTGPNNPTVITSFSPTFGPSGATVTISGFNFGSNPAVEFDGTTATGVTVVNANTLTATVPAGATTGNITVTGTGGTDTSSGEFTVTGGSTTPAFSLSTASLTGLTANEGAVGSSRVYTVTGTNLTSNLTVTAPTNFEVSPNNSFFSANVTLSPVAGALSGVPVYVRIKSGAPVGSVSGNVTHVGGGATSQNLNISGTVASTAPLLIVSTTNLAGFMAVQGSDGISKNYTVSGLNLTGSITIAAPSDFEISLNSSSGYSNSLTLNPVSGTLANTAVHTRLKNSLSVGSYTGTITHTGGGSSGTSVALSGSVTASGGGGGTAAVLAQWTFESVTNAGAGATFGPAYAEAGLQSGSAALTGLHASSATVYSTPSGNGSPKSISANNWTTNDYYQIRFSSAGHQSLKLTFDHTGSSTGPAEFLVSYSTNGGTFTTFSNYDIAKTTATSAAIWNNRNSNSVSSVTMNLTPVTGLNNQSDVYLRFVMRSTVSLKNGSVAATGTSRLDNVVVEAVSIGTTPILAPVITSPTSSIATADNSFTYTITASNSPTSFAASGLPQGLSLNSTSGVISGTPTVVGQFVVALTASNAEGDGMGTLALTVNPNPNAPVIGGTLNAAGQVGAAFDYQITVSNSPTSYLAEGLPEGLSLQPTSGRITGTPTVSGSFAVTLTAFNAVGSDTKTLNLNIKNPRLSISVGQLTGFSANVGVASLPQTYTLSGEDLSGVITATAPTHFEISLDGASYGSSVPLNPDGNGTLSMPLSVRLAASAPVGIHSGSIIHTGEGATPSYLLLQGEAISATPVFMISANTLSPFSSTQGKPSIRQTYTVSGSGLSGDITVVCPAGFELSLNDETYAATVTLTPTAGTLPETSIYVRLTGATQGTFSGSLTHAGGGVANQLVAVTGQVTAAVGPPILSPLSGSVYTGASFRHTIVAGGDSSVTYGATGLPAGWTVNSTSGLISGTASSSAGMVNFTVSATNSQGVSTGAYSLKVVSTTEQANLPTSVVINKFANGSTHRVELLVIGDTNDLASGPPVDMRGMILKDFGSSRTTDEGGKYRFADHELWAKVKAGTLIVLSAGSQSAEDLDPADFVLRVNLGNTVFFRQEATGFNLENLDMVMIKPASMGAEGFAGGIHALAAGRIWGLTIYGSFTGKKLRSGKALTSANNIVYARSSSLADFSPTSGSAAISGNLVFGQGNTTGNSNYITELRATDQTGPTITLTGANPLTVALGADFTDPGATATDTSGDSRPVTQSGSVDTAAAGSYTRSYTATDTLGNVSTVTRAVVVEKGTPTISTPPLVSVLTEGQTLLASMPSGGSATYGGVAVSGAFTWSLPSTQPAVGTSSQFVTFTPSDVSNYQVVTFSINVTVNSAQTPLQIWATGFGLSGVNAEPGADPDGDGLSNAAEYAFVTSPMDGASRAVVQSSISGGIKITWLQRNGVTYVVKSGTDLKTGLSPGIVSQVKVSPQPVGLPEGVEQYEASLSGGTQGFLQVEAIVP